MRDFRHALRSLRRSPAFVIVAILALGLGLGLTTTMFGLIEAAVHPYVPYPHPERLFSVSWFYNMRRPPLDAYERHAVIRDQARSFDAVLPLHSDVRTVETGPNPGDVRVAAVPARLFATLEIQPLLGRSLTNGDAATGAVVISYGLWRRAFDGRDDAIGRPIIVGGEIRTVVGVMPRGMEFPRYTHVWQVLPEEAERGGGRAMLTTFVRLRPGVTPDAAVAEMTNLAERLTTIHDVRDAPFSINVRPVAATTGRVGDLQYGMTVAALAILLIACANLAGLMLARGMAKRRELALRMAMGASRWALVRQMFAEAALITVAGAAVGVLVTIWGQDIIAGRVPMQMDWIGLLEPRLSARVFLSAAGAAGIAAALFGLIPAARIARGVDMAEPLKNGGTSSERSHRRHSWLVIAELALALPLLVVAGSTLKILYHTVTLDATYAATELINGTVFGPNDAADTAGTQALRDVVAAAVRSVPGVREVAFTGNRGVPGYAITAEMAADSTYTLSLRSYPVVSPNYLRTMGLPVVAGRDFEPGDVAGPGVAIIDAVAAERLYRDGDAVGRMIRLGSAQSDAPWVRVIGIARTPALRHDPGAERGSGSLWVVGAPRGSRGSLGILVRAPRADGRLAAPVAPRLREVTPARRSYVTSWLEQHAVEVSMTSFLTQLFVTMALCALGLGAVGLYGVVAYTVSLRLREFAIRVALGADRPDVRRLVLRDAVVMILAGTGLGAVPAFGLAIPGADSSWPDPRILIAADLVLVAVMLAACIGPVRRAQRANPMDIIRAV